MRYIASPPPRRATAAPSRERRGRSRMVIMKAVICVTLDIRVHNVSRAPEVFTLLALHTGKPITAGVVAFRRRVGSVRKGRCRLLDEFNQFLPFGLTLSALAAYRHCA